MRRIIYTAAILFLGILLLGGCGAPSFKEESAKAETAAKAEFNAKKKETNHKAKEIDFYLPFGFEVKKESQSNIILKNGSKTYILFYNPHEGRESRVVFEASVAQREKLETVREYKGKGRYGYLLIDQLDEGLNEVTAGVGGAKVTTETKTGSIDDEAKTLMRIANSVKYKKK